MLPDRQAAPSALELSPGDPPLTLEEVAAHYRMNERQLRAVIRNRGVEVLRAGHTVRFDAHALLSLEEALRCHAKPEPVSASRAATTAAGSTRSRGGSRASAYENALRLTTTDSRKRRLLRSKPSSCEPSGTGRVVALAPSPKP